MPERVEELEQRVHGYERVGRESQMHLVLESKPMALSAIFYQYGMVLRRFKGHYRIAGTLYTLLVGGSIERMEREQYG